MTHYNIKDNLPLADPPRTMWMTHNIQGHHPPASKLTMYSKLEITKVTNYVY